MYLSDPSRNINSWYSKSCNSTNKRYLEYKYQSPAIFLFLKKKKTIELSKIQSSQIILSMVYLVRHCIDWLL